jgi:hypothetical protein
MSRRRKRILKNNDTIAARKNAELGVPLRGLSRSKVARSLNCRALSMCRHPLTRPLPQQQPQKLPIFLPFEAENESKILMVRCARACSALRSA